MKHLAVVFSVFICMLSSMHAWPQQSDLAGKYTAAFLSDSILEPGEWVPYPTSGQADKWQQLLPPGKHQALVTNAEQYLDHDFDL